MVTPKVSVAPKPLLAPEQASNHADISQKEPQISLHLLFGRPVRWGLQLEDQKAHNLHSPGELLGESLCCGPLCVPLWAWRSGLEDF